MTNFTHTNATRFRILTETGAISRNRGHFLPRRFASIGPQSLLLRRALLSQPYYTDYTFKVLTGTAQFQPYVLMPGSTFQICDNEPICGRLALSGKSHCYCGNSDRVGVRVKELEHVLLRVRMTQAATLLTMFLYRRQH
jgi:hypothetical protein